MREIRFRGKDLLSGEWCFGYYMMNPHYDHVISNPELGNYFVDPKTVGQFTGLTDRNGEEIYEGDVVCFVDPESGDTYKSAVFFEAGAFSVQTPTWNPCLYEVEQHAEVTGNIHETNSPGGSE